MITRMRAFLLVVVFLATCICGSSMLTAEGPTRAASAPTSAPKAGHLFGIVTDKNAKTIVVKPNDSNSTMSFQQPEENKAVATVWKTIFPDHVVELKYDTIDGQMVVTNLRLNSPIAGTGKVTGTITDKSQGMKTYVEVKSGNGPTARFVPMWDVSTKGYKKASVDAIAAANIGDKVEVTWIADPERVHMTALQVLTKATSKPVGK